jgi:hypothetical protein
MTIKESKREIIVSVFRLGQTPKILTYFINLGCVSRRSYLQKEDDPFNYIAKNREQLVRANKELLKKMKKLEVY